MRRSEEALRWFRCLSAFQHGTIVVLIPFAVFTFLLILLEFSLVSFAYVAVAGFVSYAVLIPAAFIYILAVRLREEE